MNASKKAYLAGFGAGASLVAASVVAFLALSALLSFDGWPGSSGRTADQVVSIGGGNGARASADGSVPEQVVTVRPSALRTRRQAAPRVAPASASTAGSTGRSTTATSSPRTTTPSQTTPQVSTPNASTPAAGQGSPVAPRGSGEASEPLQNTVDRAGQTATDLTGSLGAVVRGDLNGGTAGLAATLSDVGSVVQGLLSDVLSLGAKPAP